MTSQVVGLKSASLAALLDMLDRERVPLIIGSVREYIERRMERAGLKSVDFGWTSEKLDSACRRFHRKMAVCGFLHFADDLCHDEPVSAIASRNEMIFHLGMAGEGLTSLGINTQGLNSRLDDVWDAWYNGVTG